MNLTEAQAQIVKDNHRFRVLACGRKFGKTTLAIYEMLGKAIAKGGRQIAYLATSYGEARDIAWERLKKISGGIWADKPNESRLELRIKTIDNSTSVIYLKGWEAVETLRGMEFDLLVPDETQNYRNFWLGWHEVLRPTLSPRHGEALFMGTPKGFNHFYDLFNFELKDKDFKSFHFTTYDNPHVPKEEIDKAQAELPEDRFAQEYLADFRKTQGLVYKEFDRKKHVYTELPKHNVLEKFCGIDFGYTNPAAIISIERDSDNNFYIVSEWYKQGKLNQDIIEYTASLRVNASYADPAEPDRIVEMKKAGLNVREVNKDVAKGIDAVRTLFKNNKIFIHASCINLILELETYSYQEKRANQNEPEEPIKENDHCVDALRYALYMQSFHAHVLSGTTYAMPRYIHGLQSNHVRIPQPLKLH